MTNTSGWPARVQSGRHAHPAGAVHGGRPAGGVGQPLPQRRGLHPGRPHHRDRVDPDGRRLPCVRLELDVVRLDCGHVAVVVDLDLHLSERGEGLAGERRVERRQHAVLALHQHDPGLRRVDGAEVVAHRQPGQLADRPRPSPRPSARRRRSRTSGAGGRGVRVRLALGPLERGQHPAADLGRVLDGLEPRGERRPTRRGRSSGASSRWRGRGSRTAPRRRRRGGPPCGQVEPGPPRRAGRGCSAGGCRTDRSGAAMFAGDSAPVATWYRSGWNRWKLRRSMRVTSTGLLASPRAASSPPNPPPTTTTRGRGLPSSAISRSSFVGGCEREVF